MDDRILLMEKYLKEKLDSESTGHDYYHALRVAKIAINISENMGGNKEIIYVASLVHDLIDHKLFDDVEKETNLLYKRLYDAQYNMFEVELIFEIINNISYSKGKVANTLEGKIVQDADRLDALGAIGIARTFAYGGKMNRMIYDENKENTLHSVQHFYDKLLLLKDFMHTEYAKEIANKRTLYMEEFLKHFYEEWNVSNIK